MLLLLPALGRAQVRFRFPAEDPEGVLFLKQPIIHMDHDGSSSEERTACVAYSGLPFPWCYDAHTGTDFLLRMGFATMDENEVKVVAGAEGEVIEAEDGNYDRCHAVQGEVSCDGHPMQANLVRLRHADGLVSSYLHLKQGSVRVQVGERVACGQLLGHVGSSGISAAPHLHFELAAAEGAPLDPFAGPRSQPESYWLEQSGPFGRPAALCPGEEPPGETAPDGGGKPARPDGGPAAAIDGGGATAPGRGCALSASGPQPGDSVSGAVALLGGLLLGVRRRRRR